MTIQSSTARVSFVCNGGSTVFPVNIQAYLNTDFLVLVTNAATGLSTPLTLNSDYTLIASGSLAPPFWTLTTQTGQLTSPFASGNTLQVILNPTATQLSQYTEGQAFPSLAVQTNLDRLTQMVIRMLDLESRAIDVPDGDVNPAMTLPAAYLRASKNLGFDVNGNVALNTQLASGTISTATLAPYLNLLPIAAEAGVSVVSQQYPIGDVRRYAASFGTGGDDTVAWQSLFNVGAAGWGELFGAGNSIINSASGVTVTRGGNWSLYAPGCTVTRGALCTGPAITLNTGGNSAGVKIEGLIGADAVFNNQPWILGAFALNTNIYRCAFLNVYQPILMDDQTLGNDGTGSIQSNIENCIFFNTAGAYGIVLRGAANATNIRSNYFCNTNTAGILLTNDAGFVTLPASVLIDGNWFQGSGSMTAGVVVQHATAAGSLGIFGLECANNRFENMTYCYAFNGVPAGDSNLPPMLRGTKYESSTYLSNPSGITINQWDFGLTPLSSPSLSSYAGYTLKSQTGSLNFNGIVGQGINVQNFGGTLQYVIAQLKSGGGALLDLPQGGVYRISGNTLLAGQATGYGTPTGGSHQASFAAGSITLPNLAAVVAQMIIDLKGGNMPAA